MGGGEYAIKLFFRVISKKLIPYLESSPQFTKSRVESLQGRTYVQIS